MIYLSGCTADSYEADLIDIGVGLFAQPGSGYIKRLPRFATWAADNNCVSMVNGVPTLNPKWTCATWARMLGAIRDLDEETCERCLFILAPDYPLRHDETLERFRFFAPIIRAFGLPVAFALQNGCSVFNVPWSDFDVAFMGGDNEWKLGRAGFDMVCHARKRGKWVHMGRVNSWERLDHASAIGCDSSDGTFIKHGPPALMVERIKGWLDNNNPRLTQMMAVP